MKAKKVLAILVLGLLVFALLASQFVILAEADHECAGEDCPICQILALAKKVLEGLSLLLPATLLATKLQRKTTRVPRSADQAGYSVTPVLLKVKLTN